MMLSGYCLESRNMNIDRIVVGPLSANCYIIQLKKKVLIIDPGAEPERIISFLDSKNLKPDLIINTHGHFDHIGAVPGLQEKYGIDFYIHPGDEEIITDPVKNGSSIFGQNKLSLETYDFIDDAAKKFFADLGIVIINTPGHSPGCIVIKIGDNLFTGDLLFKGSIGRTDLAGGSMNDMKNSLLRVSRLEDCLKIYPGHGPETDLKYEKNNNYYLGDDVLF
jgi:glyoxylase-like metal-dependent hydrolase (beta-lactamase superfamily II)